MMLESYLAFPAGIIISTVVSSLGIGGGILWMPFLLIALNLKPEAAVLTSLLIQTAGKGSGSIAYLRQKSVDHKLALFLLLIALPGIATGAFISLVLKPSHMETILGILIMTTAFLFVSSNQKYDDLGKPRAEIKKAYRYSWVAMLVSIGSGMLSTGMGEWLIPVMRSKLSLKMSSAIATCIFLTFGICFFAALIHLMMGGKADLSIVLWGVPGVIRVYPNLSNELVSRITTFIRKLLVSPLGEWKIKIDRIPF